MKVVTEQQIQDLRIEAILSRFLAPSSGQALIERAIVLLQPGTGSPTPSRQQAIKAELPFPRFGNGTPHQDFSIVLPSESSQGKMLPRIPEIDGKLCGSSLAGVAESHTVPPVRIGITNGHIYLASRMKTDLGMGL